MNSIWIEIPDYPNYKISPEGSVLSLNYNKTGKAIILKKHATRNGYVRAGLSNSKNKKLISIHRIVAEVFCKKENHHTQVNHIDGNKRNNHFENLEWCTMSENIRHSFDVLGRNVAKGEAKIKMSKLKEVDIVNIRKMIECKTLTEIAKTYNVSIGLISKIKNKKAWKHVN